MEIKQRRNFFKLFIVFSSFYSDKLKIINKIKLRITFIIFDVEFVKKRNTNLFAWKIIESYKNITIIYSRRGKQIETNVLDTEISTPDRTPEVNLCYQAFESLV